MKPFMIYSVGREPEQFKHSGCVPIAIDSIFPVVFVLIALLLVVVVVATRTRHFSFLFFFRLLPLTFYTIHIYIPLFSIVVTTTVCNSYKKNTS